MKTHRAAMAAKNAVFLAQDAAGEEWRAADRIGNQKLKKTIVKFEKRLAKVRAELEALDRDAMEYEWSSREVSDAT